MAPIAYKNVKKGNYVYKYVFDGEIVYIGKNNTNLINRIYQHTLEKKFSPFKSADIYYAVLGNPTESSVMEMLLINKYKPRLNVTFSHEGLTIEFQEPEWIPYNPEDFQNFFDEKAGLHDRARSPEYDGIDSVPAWLEDSLPVFSKQSEIACKRFVHGQCRICGAISDDIVGIDWVAGYSYKPKKGYEDDHWTLKQWSIKPDSDPSNHFFSKREGGNEYAEYDGNRIHAISCCPTCYSSFLNH